MKLDFVNQGDVCVYFPEGKLDHSESFILENKMTEFINEGATNIIFDLSKLDYISSSGIRVFISIIRQLNKKQGRIAFCSPSASVSTIIEMVFLQDELQIFPTLFEALSAFGAGRIASADRQSAH